VISAPVFGFVLAFVIAFAVTAQTPCCSLVAGKVASSL